MKKVAIIGATGYTGGELIRILLQHPQVEITSLYSRSRAGVPVGEVHEDLFHTDLCFTSNYNPGCDIFFLCLGHGASKGFLVENNIPSNAHIIDLSHDFRMKGDHNFVYGLPELQRKYLIGHRRIANPGCFATAIQLALLPLAAGNKLNEDIHVQAITGSTGAGKTLRETTHFTWRNNNVSIYKAFNHQHLAEIKQSLGQTQSTAVPSILFVPMRGNFPRGILASTYLRSGLTEDQAIGMFEAYYDSHPFVSISSRSPNVKQVSNTNHAVVQVRKHGGHLHIVSAIDNLVKGASGQAVQNMNLSLGWPETTGLQLKSLGL